MLLIGDGVTPGNEGRGYVLRRLLRRTIRSARLLGVTDPVMPTVMAVVRDLMSPSYPELATDFDRIEKVAVTEERAFLRTIASGSKLFEVAAAELAQQQATVLPGGTAFTLHDTQGFPIDLTLEMAAEAGLKVDVAEFERLMKEQKERARADAKARKGGFADLTEYRRLLDQGATEFTGYSELQTHARIRGLLRDGAAVPAAVEGDEVELILDRTPLYAESGGQDSDAGTIVGANGSAEVLDVQKVDRKLYVHRIRITDGEFTTGSEVLAKVDPEWRIGARQAHSGTHVLHAALRQVLGPDALQSGSYNKPGYLRLDFAWDQALSAATRSELEEVSNRAVRADLPVKVVYGSMQEAQAMGAIALFGETYDDTVRIVEIGGPWSVELCGGTHVEHSSQIGPLAITSESSVGSGLRRVEAAVGIEAFHKLAAERALVNQLAGTLKVQPAELPGRIEALLDKLKAAEKELAGLRQAALGNVAGTLAAGAIDVGGVAVVAGSAPDGTAAGDLRTLASDVRGRLGDRPAVVALFAPGHGSVPFAVAVNPAGVARGLAAGDLAKALLPVIEGRGGGKKDLAQGAGTRPDRVPEAIDALRAAVLAQAG
jgi:alanyl-tRNA synthetase